ncbi:hypothetical protein [Streptomyces sp. NPDC001380]
MKHQVRPSTKKPALTVPKGSCNALGKQGGLPGGLLTACRQLYG